MNGERFHRNMRAVWDADQQRMDGARYVAQATGKHHGHWGVFDRQRERFLTDDEVARMSVRSLTETRLAN